MFKYALIKDGSVINTIVAKPGWEHPDGELVLLDHLTEEWAEKQGIEFARNGKDIKEAYSQKKTIVLGGVSYQEVYQLLHNDIPKGCFIAGSTGTTGKRKMSCTPWNKIERRAEVFLELMGSEFVGPVWFPDAFSVTAFSSTGRMACLLNDIECYFGPTTPVVTPKVIAGTPRVLASLVEKLPSDVLLIMTGALVTSAQLQTFLESGLPFIDFYSSTDGGSIFANKYAAGDPAYTTVFAENSKPVIGSNGILEIPTYQTAERYLTHEVPTREGRFITGDKAIQLKTGSLKITGRQQR